MSSAIHFPTCACFISSLSSEYCLTHKADTSSHIDHIHRVIVAQRVTSNTPAIAFPFSPDSFPCSALYPFLLESVFWLGLYSPKKICPLIFCSTGLSFGKDYASNHNFISNNLLLNLAFEPRKRILVSNHLLLKLALARNVSHLSTYSL